MKLLRLPEESARVDVLLDDAVFFTPFVPFFDPRIGRPSPMETYLRLKFALFAGKAGDRYNPGVTISVLTPIRDNVPSTLPGARADLWTGLSDDDTTRIAATTGFEGGRTLDAD